MKNTLFFSKIIFASVLAATTLISCEKNNPSVLPEFTGEIKLDRTLIGAGQKLTASYAIPTGGSNIEPGKIYWNCDDSKIRAEPTEKDGISTINFIVAYKAGEHEIECARQYLNFDMAESQTKSIKRKFTVAACDVLTSFWNDSKAVVMATANEKFSESPESNLIAIIKDELDRETEIHQYFFEADKLNKIVVLLLKSFREGLSVSAVNAGANKLEYQGFARASYEYIDMATGAKTVVDVSKLNDVTYTRPISTGVETGKLGLLVVLHSAKATANVSYKMGDGGLTLYSVTYVPR